MPGGSHEFERLMAAGIQSLRDERSGEAARRFQGAIDWLDAQAPQASAPTILARCEAVVQLASALFGLGRLAETEPLLDDALASLGALPPASAGAADTLRGMLLLAYGCCRVIRRDLAAARADFIQALTLLPTGTCDLQRARAMTWLGSACCMANEVEDGLAWLQKSAQLLEQPALSANLRERVTCGVNMATAQSELGHLDEACAGLERAEALLEGMLSVAPHLPRLELARLRMNLSSAHRFAGRLDEAMRLNQSARAGFEAGIRRAGKAVDSSRMRASRATLLMDLGTMQMALGRNLEAEGALRASSRAFSALVSSRPHLRPDLARTWVSQARLAMLAGRVPRACQLYLRGLATFETMIGEGAVHLEPDRAQAMLGLARARLRQGRSAVSFKLFDAAMTSLSALTRQGRLQFVPVWLAAWQAQMAALVDRLDRESDAPATCALAGASLLRALDEAPPRGSSADDAPEVLSNAADAIVGWCGSLAAHAGRTSVLSDAVSRFLGYLLAWVAELLAESEPAWLERRAGPLQDALRALREAAAVQPEASVWLVDWFLHTRGLRAQRNALTLGSDPRLLDLRQLLGRLRQLEDEMLGALRTVKKADPSGSRGAAPEPGLSLPTDPVRADAQALQWRELHQRFIAERQAAVAGGWLPSLKRLDAKRAAAALAPRSALVLLAAGDADELLVMVMRGASLQGPPVTRHSVIRRRQGDAAFSVKQLNIMARHALIDGAGRQALRAAAMPLPMAPRRPRDAPDVHDLDQFALDQYAALWRDALSAELRQLADEGVVDICLVPSEEFHLLPWRHLADADRPAALRWAVYPDAGAWLRCRVLEDAGPAADAAPPRWAAVSWAAMDSHCPLPWVDAESHLSMQLWQEAGRPFLVLPSNDVRASGVSAFIGMGHGAAPAGNPACAGLALPGQKVLGAHDLHAVHDCVQVLMSACVLGVTEEVFGEALGFLSSCFDARARFGVGWLVEVPDFCACLFSLALQFELRRSLGREGVLSGPGPWGQAFDDTRRSIIAGRWPAGFGAWLRQVLPAVDATALATAPPAQLMRLAPWAVAFGG